MAYSVAIQAMLDQKETLDKQIRQERIIKARQLAAKADKCHAEQKDQCKKKIQQLDTVIKSRPFDVGLIDYLLDEVFIFLGLDNYV